MVVAWEPPIAYTGVVTGYLLQSALYCPYRALLEARRSKRIPPGEARRLARRMLEELGRGGGWRRLTIAGEALGVPVIVSPDWVYVEEGRPRILLRARIRSRLRTSIYDWAPLMLAALVLDEAGGHEPLLEVVVAADRGALRRGLEWAHANPGVPGRGEGYLASTRVYDRGEALRLLAPLVGVLAGERLPGPPPGPGRCARCPLRGECPYGGSTL